MSVTPFKVFCFSFQQARSRYTGRPNHTSTCLPFSSHNAHGFSVLLQVADNACFSHGIQENKPWSFVKRWTWCYPSTSTKSFMSSYELGTSFRFNCEPLVSFIHLHNALNKLYKYFDCPRTTPTCLYQLCASTDLHWRHWADLGKYLNNLTNDEQCHRRMQQSRIEAGWIFLQGKTAAFDYTAGNYNVQA